MATAVVVGRGPELFLVVAAPALPVAFRRGTDLEDEATEFLETASPHVPADLLEAIARLDREARLAAGDAPLAHALAASSGRPVREATIAELRDASLRLPLRPAAREREFALRVARISLDRALDAPEEVLITLAREEERVERALGREERAMESFLTAGSATLREYRGAWSEVRDRFLRHHERLEGHLEASARTLVPNLSSIVGEKVAARLVAAAGGLASLGRMRSARLQLLGSRRRPSPERGPRYGVIYRAARMSDVPLGRRGAYARSLAALASIAVRADATTHRDLRAALVARRDRRVEALRGQRR